MVEIVIEPELYDRLIGHLHGSDTEEVAFLAGRDDSATGAIVIFDILVIPADDFAVQTDYHVRLGDAVRGQVIRWAHDRAAILVEAHAHLSSRPASFSPSDLSGLDAWVPHVLWRLSGRPYVALVFGHGSYDALMWSAEGAEPVRVEGLRVGGERLAPTSLSQGNHRRDEVRG